MAMASDRTPIQAALVVLSLITGEEWDENKLINTADTLQQVALNTLMKQGMSRPDAADIVAERFERFVAPIPPASPRLFGEQSSRPTLPPPEIIAERVAARIQERRKMSSSD